MSVFTEPTPVYSPREDQKELSRRFADAGWFKVYDFITLYHFPWFEDNGITEVYRLPLLNEIWFQNEDEAMAFKLWRGK